MNQPVVYVLTHDSIWLGEDGPTHQAIEHTESLRIIPNVTVFRPADAQETRAAWLASLRSTKGPSVLALTRQNVPVFPKPEGEDIDELVAKGGYIAKEAEGDPALVVVATGSEVTLTLEGLASLPDQGQVRSGGIDALSGVVPGAAPRVSRRGVGKCPAFDGGSRSGFGLGSIGPSR